VTRDPYDDVPYTSHAYAESHPDRLAVVAKLSGWEAPEIEDARVLELGCGVGGNLLPMAEGLPRATFVGVDRSKRQIALARAAVEAARLANVTLHDARFEDVALGAPFDFVIAHGVYSWIAIEVRRALLRVVARSLAPGGVAYVSFNALPGWYAKMAARDWLRFAEPALGMSGARALAWLKERASPELDTYRRDLDRVAARLDETDAAYLVHEYLSEEHHPEHVGSVIAEAEAAGLRYLGDAIPSTVALELLDEEARSRARDVDVVRAQTLVDFVRQTSFRRALFVHADECDARGWRWRSELDPRAIDGLRVASRLRVSNDGARVEGPDGILDVDPGARDAFRALAEIAPRSIAFEELCAAGARDALRSELFDVWLAIGGLDLHAFEPRIAGVSDRPTACAVARHAARTNGPITNAWHQEVRVEDVVRFVLARCDGARAMGEIAGDVRGALAAGALAFEGRSGAIAPADAEALVRASVEVLAKSALLVA